MDNDCKKAQLHASLTCERDSDGSSRRHMVELVDGMLCKDRVQYAQKTCATAQDKWRACDANAHNTGRGCTTVNYVGKPPCLYNTTSKK